MALYNPISFPTNQYLPLAGGTMSGNIDMDFYNIENVPSITFPNESTIDFGSRQIIEFDSWSTNSGETILNLSFGTYTSVFNSPLKYDSDYSMNYDSRSLIDKGFAEDTFLRLNGNSAMEGNLNMDGNSIFNVGSITADDVFVSGGTVTAGNVFSSGAVNGSTGNFVTLNTNQVTSNGATTIFDLQNRVFSDEADIPLSYASDYSTNYTNRSLIDKEYVDNLLSSYGLGTFTQIHTTGATVTANDDTTALYIDPASPLAALTITLAANPTDGQEVKISFGGTITLGNVITFLTVQGNAGDTILSGSSITQADAGEGYIFKYQESTNLWRQF